MHLLHTTPAFVLTSYPHGESSRVYKLFTRERGVLYVHAQSVRDMKNRNRYALATHTHASVTLVRGKGVWRLTSARSEGQTPPYEWRRALALAGRLLPQEDPATELFDLLYRTRQLTGITLGEATTCEAILALFVLHTLGYVARPRSSLAEELLTSPLDLVVLSREFQPRHKELVKAVNVALEGVPTYNTKAQKSTKLKITISK